MEQKRLFVGNLPLSVNEEDIKKKFSKFGRVISAEVKQRFGVENELISKFGYVTLEANRSNIDTCMQTLTSKTWKGYNLNVAIAKESFLTVLERERDEDIKRKLAGKDEIPGLEKHHKVDKSPNSSKQMTFDAFSNGYNSDTSDKQKNYLPKFGGTHSSPMRDEIVMKDKIHSKYLSNQVLESFEKFSNVWRDGFDVEVVPNAGERINRNWENKSVESSHTFEKNKKTKENYRGKSFNSITERKNSKQFLESATNQNESDDEKSDDNLKESSDEDYYKTLKKKSFQKNKIDIELTRKSDLQSFNITPNFHNKWYTDKSSVDQSFQNKTFYDSSSPTKRKENCVFPCAVYSDKKIENKNCTSEVTESDFKKIAEEKRKRAFEEKRQLLSQQKNAVKNSLAKIDKREKPNKKIIFNDDGNTDENKHGDPNVLSNDLQHEKKMLFDEESDNEETSFKVNVQFEGIKGQKLLELQSRYAHDKRFTLDSRFYESDDENLKAETSQPKNEKEKQLEILEQVIGYQMKEPESSKKNVKQVNTDTMLLRFDPTRVEHSQFVIRTTQAGEKISKEKKRKKKEVENEETYKKQVKIVEVSKETFYKIDDKLKDSLKSKDDSSFSLRKLFSSKDRNESEVEDTDEKDVEESTALPPKRMRQSNPFRYDSSDPESDHDEDDSVQLSKEAPQHTLFHPFFFQVNDSRFEELKEFFGNHEKITEEEFSKKRKDLKRLIHHRQMNEKQKNRPFKTKLGGSRNRIDKKRLFKLKGWSQRRNNIKPHTYKRV